MTANIGRVNPLNTAEVSPPQPSGVLQLLGDEGWDKDSQLREDCCTDDDGQGDSVAQKGGNTMNAGWWGMMGVGWCYYLFTLFISPSHRSRSVSFFLLFIFVGFYSFGIIFSIIFY